LPVRQTALIVAVPEASALVDPWRMRYTSDAPAGVPAHITVLFPFVAAEQVARELDTLRELLAATPSIRYSLVRVARFPSLAYLAPEPAEPFLAMTRAVVERYPGCPPYGGEIELDELVPHLTVAEGDAELLDEVARALAPSLPLVCAATEVLLIEESPTGTWGTRQAFPLATS
jgi:2'-5' RNA ligase